jgi:hypothetical protein
MAKHHGGTHHIQGVLENRGTAPRPSPLHGGTNLPKGVTHAPQPRVYGNHGGTSLRQGVLKGK